MASTFNCRGCRVSLGSKVIPEFMGIGSLFGDEDANDTTDSLFCAKCTKSHANSSMKVQGCGHHNIMNKFQRTTDDLCYFPECAKTKSRAQTEDDDCVFCSEILASATCVSFTCGHLFHETCITTHIRNMLSPTSGRITITNSFCPLCKEDIQWSGEYSDIQRVMGDVTALRDHLKSMCVAQIQKEDGKNGLPSNPLEYGMKKYNFYQCKKCRSIYCGGKRECGEEEPEGENIYLCGGCRGCPKHGDEYMSYKCRYCCNEALYFCFGHTHYCDYCHSHNLRATGTNHQYMSSAPPACEGRHKCPLKIDHPPHGEEFALRCTACADEVKTDEFGSDIENLYKSFYAEKLDLVLEALAQNRLANLFLVRVPEIVRAEEDDIDGFWDLRALVGEEVEAEERGREEEEEVDLRDLFGEEEEEEEEEEKREEEGEWEHMQPLFNLVEEHAKEENAGPSGPNSDGPTVLPTTPSSPLLKFLSFSKLMYINLPQLAVVAATAAFLNSASFTLV